MSRIKNTLKENRIHAKKGLGQNFLSNEQALASITLWANLNISDCVLEIGAGIGNLSSMIAPLAGEFYALEKDQTFKKILHKELAGFKNTKIIFSDILKFDFGSIFSGKKIKVIGNLPYYITSPILLRLLDQKEYIQSIVITVQKEVARRIVSPPGSKDYGRLSCLLQYHTKTQLLEIFPKHFFIPQPEVDSALVKLQILDKPSVKVKSEKLFFSVCKAIFSHRRKTLINSLIASGGLGLKKEELVELLDKVEISASIRGEQLSLTEIGKIADEIYSQK